MNIIAIEAAFVPQALTAKYGLVPDTHHGAANWYKIVVMEHVEIDALQEFIADLETLSDAASDNYHTVRCQPS